jgi:inosine triphosphate pyrophosphatase
MSGLPHRHVLSNQLKCPVIVEDTALEFEAFGGLPGPYIKWFLKGLGNQGLYDMLAKFDKNARAVCTFAYCEGPGKSVQLFQGIHEGEIVAPRGPPDFGWNPIFKPKESNKTYAEMTAEEKSKVSHRFLALQKLSKFLDELEGGEGQKQ